VLVTAITAGACDVVLLPLGASCDLRFEDEVLPLARRRGVGTLAMKAFGAGKLLGTPRATISRSRPARGAS